ncbi:MAG: redoxin domain-containing protein [Gemmatimonadetes bacterium]|nr:redoxin domain-containing protein [Gemmatimonadota bacterium]
MELNGLLTEEQRADTEILAVAIDPRERLDMMVQRVIEEGGLDPADAPDFRFLSDPGHRVIDRYGVLNPDDERGIPHPTTLVLDREGIVRWKFIETDYRIRPTNEMILEALAALD